MQKKLYGVCADSMVDHNILWRILRVLKLGKMRNNKMPAIKNRHFIAQIIVTNKLLHGCEIYGYEITYKIYEIMDNVPYQLLGTNKKVLSATFNSDTCTRSELSEIMNTLAVNNIIDITFANKEYYDVNKNFEIHLLT